MARTDNDLLAMALVGYEAQKARLEATIKEIESQLGHRSPGRPKATADGAVAPAGSSLSAQCAAKDVLFGGPVLFLVPCPGRSVAER